MKTTKRVEVVFAMTDGLSLSFTAGEREAPEDVRICFLSVDGARVSALIAAEDLERLAKALEQYRSRELAHFREVCPEHGYFELGGPTSYRCPKCEPLAKVSEAVAS